MKISSKIGESNIVLINKINKFNKILVLSDLSSYFCKNLFIMINYREIYQKEHIENGLSYSKIRNKYNISRGTWDYYIRYKLGLSCDRRKHKANDLFFHKIDTEEKAYLLGFLYADGYLASDGRIGCRLNIDDIEIIKLLQKHIAQQSPIEYTNNQNFKRKQQVSIRWKSSQMYKDLQNLGFCIDKTHENSNIFKYIPINLKNHFIRGYCDGDGSIRFEKHKTKKYYRCSVSFVNGSNQILNDINNWFIENYKCSGVLKKHKNYYRLSYEKASDAFIISKHLYENANIFLKRKYNNAINMINYRTNTELTGKIKTFPVV